MAARGDEYDPETPPRDDGDRLSHAGVFPTQITEKEFESRVQPAHDMVSTTSVAFLGLTLAAPVVTTTSSTRSPPAIFNRMAATSQTAVSQRRGTGPRHAAAARGGERVFWAKRAETGGEGRIVRARRASEALRNTCIGQAERRRQGDDWSVLDFADTSTTATKFTRLPEARAKIGGNTPRRIPIRYGSHRTPPHHAIRVEALSHYSLPKKGPRLAPNGNSSWAPLNHRGLPPTARVSRVS